MSLPPIIGELEAHARKLEAAARKYQAEYEREREYIDLYEAGKVSLDAYMAVAAHRDAAWKAYFELTLEADELVARSVRLRPAAAGGSHG